MTVEILIYKFQGSFLFFATNGNTVFSLGFGYVKVHKMTRWYPGAASSQCVGAPAQEPMGPWDRSEHVLKGSVSLLMFSHHCGRFGDSSCMACVHLKQERGAAVWEQQMLFGHRLCYDRCWRWTLDTGSTGLCSTCVSPLLSLVSRGLPWLVYCGRRYVWVCVCLSVRRPGRDERSSRICGYLGGWA